MTRNSESIYKKLYNLVKTQRDRMRLENDYLFDAILALHAMVGPDHGSVMEANKVLEELSEKMGS